MKQVLQLILLSTPHYRWYPSPRGYEKRSFGGNDIRQDMNIKDSVLLSLYMTKYCLGPLADLLVVLYIFGITEILNDYLEKKSTL